MSLEVEVENEIPELDELSEIDSLRSENDLYSDSDDEFIPPPPPLEENISLASCRQAGWTVRSSQGFCSE